MFTHRHPYEPFLFEGVQKLIVGTLPPPRFTTRQLRPGDVDFCYGSRDGQLWPILDRIFSLDLIYDNTPEAVAQRRDFLRRRSIGICDIVESANREKIDASDLGMKDIKLRNLIGYLEAYPTIDTLLFTGGNSKNGPEYLFRKLLREHGLSLMPISDEVPRKYQIEFPLPGGGFREVRTVSLTAPSGSANRAVGSIMEYKTRKAQDPSYTVLDFRVEQYRKFF